MLKQTVDLKKQVAEEKAAQLEMKQRHTEEFIRFQDSLLQKLSNEMASREAGFRAHQQAELERMRKSLAEELAKVQVSPVKRLPLHHG